METPLLGDLDINSMTVTTRYGINGVRDIALSGTVELDECRDTHGTALDVTATGCDWYEINHKYHCGKWDDHDFRAKEMCCACHE